MRKPYQICCQYFFVLPRLPAREWLDGALCSRDESARSQAVAQDDHRELGDEPQAGQFSRRGAEDSISIWVQVHPKYTC